MPRSLTIPTSSPLRVPMGRDVITASGTWTRPSGVTEVLVSLTGGGGFRGSNNRGCGATIWRRRMTVTGNVTVTIGAAATVDDTNGGSTSFGALSVAGGVGGVSPYISGSAGALRGVRTRLVQTSGNDATTLALPTFANVLDAPDPSQYEGVEFAGLQVTGPYRGFWSAEVGNLTTAMLGDFYGSGGTSIFGQRDAKSGLVIVEWF